MSKTINIEDFYTEENEKNGVWHEPVIDGEPCGVEFLLIGIHSEEAIKNMDKYDEILNNAKEEEREEMERDIDAARVASLTKGVRGANGEKILVEGKEVEFDFEFIKKLYLNAPLIKMDNIEFAIKTSNFMKKSS